MTEQQWIFRTNAPQRIMPDMCRVVVKRMESGEGFTIRYGFLSYTSPEEIATEDSIRKLTDEQAVEISLRRQAVMDAAEALRACEEAAFTEAEPVTHADMRALIKPDPKLN